VKILVQSVFEGVVYHCSPIDLGHPGRPTLEVDALLRPGDADSGPLLLPVADYIRMVGIDVARPHLEDLAARGRIVRRLDVEHISFPTWTTRGSGSS
jgi:hypothetical protein